MLKLSFSTRRWTSIGGAKACAFPGFATLSIYSMKEFVRNKTTVVSSRISKEMAKHLAALSESRNVTVGTYLRMLIREYLSCKSGIRLP